MLISILHTYVHTRDFKVKVKEVAILDHKIPCRIRISCELNWIRGEITNFYQASTKKKHFTMSKEFGNDFSE